MWPCLFVVVVFVVLVLSLVVILLLKLFFLQEAQPGDRRARVAVPFFCCCFCCSCTCACCYFVFKVFFPPGSQTWPSQSTCGQVSSRRSSPSEESRELKSLEMEINISFEFVVSLFISVLLVRYFNSLKDL